MNKLFRKIFVKVFKKAVKKAVSTNNVVVPEVEPVIPSEEPAGNSKQAIWKFIIQTLISILTAILTAFTLVGFAQTDIDDKLSITTQMFLDEL